MTKKNETAATAAKPAKPAKGAKASGQAATSGAKVGKVASRTAPAAGQAKGRGAKASGQGQSGQSGQRAPRGQYADKRITLTGDGKVATPRGNRGVRWEIIKKAKNTNDVLGQKFTRTDGQEGTITSAGLSNFVERGWIELS